MAYTAEQQAYLDRFGYTDPSQIDRSSYAYVPGLDPWNPINTSQYEQKVEYFQEASTAAGGEPIMSAADVDYLDPAYMPGWDPYSYLYDDRPLAEQFEEKQYEQMVDEELARLRAEQGIYGTLTAAKPMPDTIALGGTPTTTLLEPAKKKPQ